MADKKINRRTPKYEPESWRDEAWRNQDARLSPEDEEFMGSRVSRATSSESLPGVRDQTKVLELLGRINYKIIKGGQVYIEAGGVVYKTLYGGYWRSVFTGVEHYLFRCEQVSGAVWAEDDEAETVVDLPIVYSRDGWSASGHSLSFMLSREEAIGSRPPAVLQRRLKSFGANLFRSKLTFC